MMGAAPPPLSLTSFPLGSIKTMASLQYTEAFFYIYLSCDRCSLVWPEQPMHVASNNENLLNRQTCGQKAYFSVSHPAYPYTTDESKRIIHGQGNQK